MTLSPELGAFLGSLAGGAVAGLATSIARWKRVEQRLEQLADAAADRAVTSHADACQLRAVAGAHLAAEVSGRYPLPSPNR